MSFERKLQSCRLRPGFRSFPACFALLAMTCGTSGLAQITPEFHKTLAVSNAEPVNLKIELFQGDLEITYSREGEVSIAALARASDEMNVPSDLFSTWLSVKAVGNQIEIRQQLLGEISHGGIKVGLRIDVPYRTEVHSVVNAGKQTITGLMGPVTAETNDGDIKISYVSKAVVAHAVTGSLNLHVIGEHVEAKTGRGNISCSRAAHGVRAETEDGDVSLMVVGPSEARVKSGAGTIDVGGVRGTLVASTDTGDLHVKAVPHDDWQLNSVSGTVHVELPPAAKFNLNTITNSGTFVTRRDDLQKPDARVRNFTQRVNGGGKRIEVHTESGRIVVS